MNLDKKQLRFLKSLPQDGSMTSEAVKDSAMSVILFLSEEKLICIERELGRIWIDESKGTYRNSGNIVAVSVSQRGMAYLETDRRDRRSALLKDVIMPIMIRNCMQISCAFLLVVV